MVEWTNDELSKHEHHALVVIAAFAYEFISIHPFREGKGELSRILSTLLLLQNGYEWAKFESIDNLIEKRRTEYYGTLKEGQQIATHLARISRHGFYSCAIYGFNPYETSSPPH